MITVICWGAAAVWLIIPAGALFAGQIRVSPPDRIVFDHKVKSSMVTVVNEGKEPVTIDISPVGWNQDADGRDSFAETQELVVFPKVMTLAAGEQRVIRVGYRGAPLTREMVCRILIGERSGAAKNAIGRMPATSPLSVPVFIKPVEEKVTGSLQTMVLSDGQLTIVVKNSGNAHLIVISLSIRGAASDGSELFTRELAGSYVLSGMSKPFRTAIPVPICGKLSRAEVQITTDIGPLSGTLDIESGMCGQ